MIGGSVFVSPDETTALLVPNAEKSSNRNVCLLDAKNFKVQGRLHDTNYSHLKLYYGLKIWSNKFLAFL